MCPSVEGVLTCVQVWKECSHVYKYGRSAYVSAAPVRAECGSGRGHDSWNQHALPGPVGH
eukprot:363843-Chlamydomonas_euryale.AAC.3